MSATERMGMGWLLWVLGWGLLVGGGVFVVPSYFVFGSEVAVWVAGGVAGVTLILCWLGYEAAQALNLEAQHESDAGLAKVRSETAL